MSMSLYRTLLLSAHISILEYICMLMIKTAPFLKSRIENEKRRNVHHT